MQVVIVGAGAAGLHVAHALAKRGYRNLHVYEASPKAGGRVRTKYDAHGAIEYESGPWRVARNHLRMRALCAAHGLRLIGAPTLPIKNSLPPEAPGLSIWDQVALVSHSAARADAVDRNTGYADQTHAASGSAPYHADGRFDIVPSGLTTLIDAMCEAAEHQGVHFHFDHRVVDCHRACSGGYTLEIRRRVGSNTFVTERVQCDAIFVCAPPAAWCAWNSMRTHARTVACAVSPGVLHHIYVKDADAPRGVHVTDPLLGQVVSTQYPGRLSAQDWFQASYSGGRVASMWHHLRLASPAVFWAQLRAALHRTLRFAPPKDAEWRSHYWPAAYHEWKPVPMFNLAHAVHSAVRLNATELPRAYLAGEAHSSHQAWIEGALETAQLAVDAFVLDMCNAELDTPRETPARAPSRKATTVYVEGHAIDVTAFAKAHPGGAAALKNHAGEDVGALMAHIGHSDHAWAVVHALKVVENPSAVVSETPF